MKIARVLSTLFSLTLWLAVLTSASFAENHLKTPTGLAVDASGNLYVANAGANQILVYNSAYAQQTTKTITDGVSEPEAVALDQYGNLWVANFTASNGGPTGSISEYIGGVLQSGNTITKRIQGPESMAFDTLNQLWIQGTANTVNVYGPAKRYDAPSVLLRTATPFSGDNMNRMTVGAGVIMYGTTNAVGAGPIIRLSSASTLLRGAPFDSTIPPGTGASALTPDNLGNIYVVDGTNTVYIEHPDLSATTFVTLPFTGCFGIVLDSVHQHLYVSNTLGNQILVYSTKPGATYGTLIHTIPTTG
jgi:hypothetical protein